MGGAAGQLLPVPLEGQQRAQKTHTSPVVQSEWGKWPAVRLQAHFWAYRRAGGRVRGGEVDCEEREVIHPPLCQRAGLRTDREGALSRLPSVQRRRRPECSTVSHSEPGAASPHQRLVPLSVCLSSL